MDNAAMLTSESSDSTIKQFVCFKLANEEYAIDIQLIQEVVKVPKITDIPQMPSFCLGVINSRGNIIPVFDLRRKFKLPDREFTSDTRILSAHIDGTMISLVVDQVLDNVKFDMARVDPAPTIKMNIDREYIHGLGELEGRMIVILDLLKMHDHMLKEIMEYVIV